MISALSRTDLRSWTRRGGQQAQRAVIHGSSPEMSLIRSSTRSIAWISLGGLRFMPSLRPLIHQRFPGSRIAAQEMVRAPDGKLRYFRHIREEMYRYLIGMFRDRCGKDYSGKIMLAMEPEYMWRSVGLSVGETSC